MLFWEGLAVWLGESAQAGPTLPARGARGSYTHPVALLASPAVRVRVRVRAWGW